MQGIKPASLNKVKDPELKDFIEKCLVPASERLPAKELLKDPFLQLHNPKVSIRDPVHLPSQPPSPTAFSVSVPYSVNLDVNHAHVYGSTSIINGSTSPTNQVWEFIRTHNNNEFRLRGTRNDDNSISLTLRIADSSGTWQLYIFFHIFSFYLRGH